MFALLRRLVWASFRCILALRYRVHVHGRDALRGLGIHDKVLILPNHPGYTDPMLVMSQFGGQLQPRPLVFAGTFDNPLLWPFMKFMDALRVPDMEGASTAARETARGSVQAIIDGLTHGSNHVFWPSGRLQRGGVEVLGGARALSDVLDAVPDCTIVLVRTRGLWGSMFSFAYTGKLPELSRCMLGGLWVLLTNLVFFTPRRTITITVERLDRETLPKGGRDSMNAFFEAWYNAEGPEQPTFVPYHHVFGPRTHAYPKLAGLADIDVSGVKDAVKDEVVAIIADTVKRPLIEAERRPETTLDSLGLDSLDRMDLSLFIEQRFGFSTDQVPTTLGQCQALAAGLVDKGEPPVAPEKWFQPIRAERAELLGDTIPEAFVTRALRCLRDPADADDLAGCLDYERMLVASLAFARRFEKIGATNVGLMLPASVVGDICFLGLHLAGRLPVVLNWTTGPANLAHAAKAMGLTHVVTSRKFLDRTGLDVPGVEMWCVEDHQPGRAEALGFLLHVRLRPGSIRRHTPRPSPDAPAVVLFTSGSEKAPKAVPLTHANLLTNIRTSIESLHLSRHDSMLGFLPAFHSFGLTVTFLTPILCGLRVVRHPDPTDAARLARKVAAYKVSVLAGTPTFISYLFDRVKGNELETLRLFFVGAEKCPLAVFERARMLAPNAVILEGYGITECSPIVSINTPTAFRPGTVGRPLPCVETRVVDIHSGDTVAAGEMGLLLVAGPTIFHGYHAYEGDSPFREHDGKRWYVTGDLVQIEEGFIRFCGRLKRFIKAGGEMVSLPALEEPLARSYPPGEDGPRVAVEGIEIDGGRMVVLFTTEEISLRDANAVLWEAGLRGVMRLDDVRRVDTIPVLGTGKTDYKVLRSMITAP